MRRQALVEVSAAAVTESVRLPAPQSDAARREIWVRRRVSLSQVISRPDIEGLGSR